MKIYKVVWFSLTLLLNYPINLFAQYQLREASKEDFASYENLSNYLCKNQKSDEKKVRAIHWWITKYVAMDDKQPFDDQPQFTPNAEQVYQRGKTSAIGYAKLMQAMLEVQDIKSEVVPGYTRKYDTDSILNPVLYDHAWIAIEINGEWKLADPYLDAGYIGHKRTNKIVKVTNMKAKFRKRYQRKMHLFEIIRNSDRDDEFKALVAKREIRARKKFAHKRRHIEEKADRMPDFKKKVAFQRWARQEYLLIPADSFLLTHLPINPMWQLRNDVIQTETFLIGEMAVRNYLNGSRHGDFDFKQSIKSYQALNESGKLMEDAHQGLMFNGQNAKLMVEHPYLVLSDYFNSGQNKQGDVLSTGKGSAILASELLDEARRYASLTDKTESAYYKFLNTFYREQQKSSNTITEDEARMIGKALSWNERAEQDMDKSWEYMARDIEKWRKINNKLYPNPRITYALDSFDFTFYGIVDKQKAQTIQTLFENVNYNREAWCGRLENSALIEIGALQKEQHRLLQDNAAFLRFKNFKRNDVLTKNNALFNQHFESIVLLYSVALKEEMYCTEYAKSLDDLYRYVSAVIDDLQLAGGHGDFSLHKEACGALEGYIQLQSDRFLADLNAADVHFYWLKSEFGNVAEYWAQLERACKRQAELNEDKMTYVAEMLSIDERRESNTLFMMKNDLKRWKELLRLKGDADEVVSRE